MSARAPCTGLWGAARRQAKARETATRGKFSQPYCIAAALVRGNVGLGDFTDGGGARPGGARARRGKNPLIASIRKNLYPNEFHRSRPRDASMTAAWSRERQPHFRGGREKSR